MVMTEQTYPCPWCGIASYWIPSADRLLHADGSETRACWRELARNGTRHPFDRPVTPWDLLAQAADNLAVHTHEGEHGITEVSLVLDEAAKVDRDVVVRQVTERVIAALRHADITAYGPDRPMIPCRPDPAGVYFIRSGDHVKIGHSRNVASRLRELTTGNPVTLRMLACVPEPDDARRKRIEQAYHDRWADLRTGRGEWFRYTDPLNAWICSLIDSGRAFVPEPA